ncbi:hypothetical protein [Streptomyces tubercidicus]|uniref:hypothetical protein n=1 Tax=Streptomyces tubercidicus TaxID=47759 RepID=UPI0036B71AB2
MAKRFEPVDESQKDEEGVQEAESRITVNGQEIVTKTYGRVVTHDDMDHSITEDVFTVKLQVPVLENVEYETGELNDDGTKKLGLREELFHVEYKIDLGKESLAKYKEALQPFFARAEKVEEPKPKKRGRPRSSSKSS